MVVGTCELHLRLPGCASLKEKRLVLRSLVTRLRHRMNVAAAEVAHQDQLQHATLGLVTLSNDSRVVHSVLSKAQKFVERDARIEILDIEVTLL